MMPPDSTSIPAPVVVIAGFGVPGRAASEQLSHRGIAHTIIERNDVIVQRCVKTGVPIIAGDARDEQTQRAAGVERAQWLLLAIPDDAAVLAAMEVARRINPAVQIIARCAYTSAGLQATRLGAVEVIVAEQLVARELTRLLESRLDGMEEKA